MAFAPDLDTANFVRSAEVVAVAILAEPPSMAGCLAGLSARGLGTVALAIFGPGIGNEKLGATTAFASGLRAAHREPHPRERRTGRKSKRRAEEDQKAKKEEKF
jgi:hypothetical protein